VNSGLERQDTSRYTDDVEPCRMASDVRENAMTYKGHVENGVIVLDGDATLPDGTSVRVEAVPSDEALESLRKGLRELSGIVKDMPPDMARNHDHYLHGTPKK